MSKLSVLFKKSALRGMIRYVVEFLEDVDIPGEQKKALAVAIVKLLHVKTGGVWDKAIERAVEGAIEFILGEIRDFAHEYVQVPEPPKVPVEGSIYGVATAGPTPSDADLLLRGFKTGDVVREGKMDGQPAWEVTEAGSFGHPGFEAVRTIGG